MAQTIFIIITWSLLLVAILKQTAFAEKESARLAGIILTLGWIGLTIACAVVSTRMGHNLKYGRAVSGMMNACISGLEQGHQEAVLRELRRMASDISYESGNFPALAERAASNLTAVTAEQGRAGDQR